MFGRQKNNLKLKGTELCQHYFLTGKERYASALFDLYYLLVAGVCFNFLKDRDESGSLALGVFQRFLQKAKEEEIRQPEAWLYRAGRNASLKYLRDRRVTISLGEHNLAVPDESDNTEQNAILEKEALLETALESLCREQRQAVSLFYLQGHSYHEISQLQGWTILQVKSYIQNGKRNLKLFFETHEKAKTA